MRFVPLVVLLTLAACDSTSDGSVNGLWVEANQTDRYLNVDLPTVELISRQDGDCWLVEESDVTYDPETGTYVSGGISYFSLESGTLVLLGGIDVNGRERISFERSDKSRGDLFDRYDLCSFR